MFRTHRAEGEGFWTPSDVSSTPSRLGPLGYEKPPPRTESGEDAAFGAKGGGNHTPCGSTPTPNLAHSLVPFSPFYPRGNPRGG